MKIYFLLFNFYFQNLSMYHFRRARAVGKGVENYGAKSS